MKLKSNKILGLILAIVMLIGCLPMNIIETYAADGDVQINETNFPDANFREYVKQFDKDNDNILSKIEIDDVITIEVDGKNITSLKGIEYFTKLKVLFCQNNKLTELNVSNNTALEAMTCEKNQLTKLDVSKNTALTELNCANNQLTELNVSNNTALTKLNCGKNQLKELDVSNNTALKSLLCEKNQLKELDVSNNTALEAMTCEKNQLTKLDVSKNTALLGLYCHANQLTSLKLNSELNSRIRIEILNQEYNIEVPKGTSELKFPEGFDTSRIVGTIPGVTINPDGKLIWDEKSNVQNIQYKLIDGSDRFVTISVKLTETANKPLEDATKLVETAERDKTKAAYDTAKAAVDQLTIGSGKTGLEERLKAVKEYLDLKDAKDEALVEIGKLANLTDEEKAPFITRVNDATTIPEVEKALEDAKNADDLKAYKEKAKEEIGNLPNLSDDEKKDFKDKVDEQQDKPGVDKVVEEAKAKDKKNLDDYKEKAKEEIGNLPNLDDQEKKDFKDKVDEQQDKPGVDKVVEEAKKKDQENKDKKDLDEYKKEAKEEIDKLPNLTDEEKDDFKGQVDQQTDKPGVDKVVDDAKKKDSKKGGGSVVPTPTPTPTPIPDYNYREIYFGLPIASGRKVPETKKKVMIETIITIGSNKLVKKIDGIATETEMDVAAYIKDDRTYIPLRFVGEALGYEVTWDEVNRTAILKNKDKEVKVAVDSNVFYVNGKKFESDVKPMIKNSRTMIPVGNFARAIGLQDGKEIFWNEATRVVTIKQEFEY